MQSTGQTSRQASQPVQPSAWITARIFGTTFRGLPAIVPAIGFGPAGSPTRDAPPRAVGPRRNQESLSVGGGRGSSRSSRRTVGPGQARGGGVPDRREVGYRVTG